jgi:hypothetical protein
LPNEYGTKKGNNIVASPRLGVYRDP